METIDLMAHHGSGLQERERLHRRMGVLAVLVSLALHAGAVSYVSRTGIPLPFAGRASAETQRARRIELDPARRLARMRDLSELDARSREMAERALSAQGVARLTVPTPSVDMYPRAIDPALEPFMRPQPLPPEQADLVLGAGSRQELVAIEKTLARDEVHYLARRLIPKIERVTQAPDIALPVDPERTFTDTVPVAPAAVVAGGTGFMLSEPKSIDPDAIAEAVTAEPVPVPEPAHALQRAVEEPSAAVTTHKPVENLLRAKLTSCRALLDPRYTYFRIDVDRLGAEVLPVLPRDVLLVQDASASMTEQRLRFCRQGLTNALAMLRPGDRFNVVQFKDRATPCFADWQPVSEASLAQARGFIDAMRSGGATDIYASIRALLKMTGEPGRPAIMLLVTDGRSTTGVTASSDIIGHFTRDNDGRFSVFAFGTIRSANRYLLDMMSYCNRGSGHVVERGRWAIPEDMGTLLGSVGRPCLTDVRFVFADSENVEVYPAMPENLYLDRPLVLYGRCPRRTQELVFQAVGRAGDVLCDMVFELDVGRETDGSDRAIRSEWGRQRVFHLVGEYARTRDPGTRKALERAARQYRVPVPRETVR